LLHQYFLEEDDPGGSRWNEMTKVWADQGHEITVLGGMMHANGNEKRAEYKGKHFVRKQQGKVNVLRCHVSESYIAVLSVAYGVISPLCFHRFGADFLRRRENLMWLSSHHLHYLSVQAVI